jgi:hypothetical protein
LLSSAHCSSKLVNASRLAASSLTTRILGFSVRDTAFEQGLGTRIHKLIRITEHAALQNKLIKTVAIRHDSTAAPEPKINCARQLEGHRSLPHIPCQDRMR